MTTSNGGSCEPTTAHGEMAVVVATEAFAEAELAAALARDLDAAFEPFVIPTGNAS